MNSCENKSIIQKKNMNFCVNCCTIHNYDWIMFDIKYDDYNSAISNILKYRKSCYKRIKYLRKRLDCLDN